jgi:hypothetical protein
MELHEISQSFTGKVASAVERVSMPLTVPRHNVHRGQESGIGITI